MDRMQPPPNYYGTPYPPEQPGYSQQPYMGQQGPMGQPNQMGGMTPPPPNIPRAESKTSKKNNEDIYEQMTDDSPGQSTYFAQTFKNHAGKNVIVYCSFPDSAKWHDIEFRGRLITAADDHIVIKDTETEKIVIIIGVYINYLEVLKD